MSTQEKTNSRDPLPWFVEFVGPRSSGKTTLLKCLKSRYGHEFSYIGCPELTLFARASTRVRQELCGRRLFNGYQLDAFSKRRLIKGFAKVTGALGWYASCRGDIFLVDEGPLRVIMDYAIHDETQYLLWRRFCITTLDDLARYRMLVVFLEAAPSVRIERGKKRRGSQVGVSSKGCSGVGAAVELSKKRWFFREEAISLLEAGKYKNFYTVRLVNEDDVGEAALRARQIINNIVSRKGW